jgi:chloride channel protein, CIC family
LHPTSPQPNVLSAGGPAGLSLRFWVAVVATGIGTGIGGGLLMALLRAVQHLSWSYAEGTFLAAVEQSSWPWRIAVLLLAGLLVGAVRWLWQQQPGGHAGEVAAALWFHCGRLPLARTMGRAVLSIVIVGMGASLGREAAPKQTGAAVGNVLSNWARLSSIERRLLVACGTGAGMAAVYNVPFGGALFSLEVLLGTLALPLIAPALTASLIATAVAWLFLPDAPTYSVPSYETRLPLLLWAAIAGPLAGLAAVIYVRAIAWADSHKPQRPLLFVMPVLIFAALGALALPFPQLLGNGKDVVQLAFVDELSLSLLVALLVLKPLATAGCIASGAPGGLFTPTLACGALLGGMLGRCWAALWPGAPVGSCAIIGAGALLAAAMQGPVSSLVLMLELTRSADALILPLMLAITGSVLVAYRLEARSIYSARIHAGRLAASAGGERAATQFDRLISQDYAVVSAAAAHDEVARLLLAMPAPKRLYVVDEERRLIGAIAGLALVPDPAPAELAMTTAADAAEPTASLSSAMPEADAIERLRRSDGPLPVVDAQTGRLMGLARLP